MGLECLIMTGDPTLLGHFQASLGTHGASIELRQDCARIERCIGARRAVYNRDNNGLLVRGGAP